MNRTNRSLVVAMAMASLLATAACSTPEQAVPSSSVSAALRTGAVHGVVATQLLNPRGEVDGVLLKDGTIVRVAPGSLSADALAVNDEVDVTGDVGMVAGARLVDRASVSRSGQLLTTSAVSPPPPPPAGEDPRAAEARLPVLSSAAEVRAILRNREGIADGLALADGTTARVPPTGGLDALGVKVGDRVELTGHGTATAKGKGIRAETLKVASGKTVTVDVPPDVAPPPPPPAGAVAPPPPPGAAPPPPER